MSFAAPSNASQYGWSAGNRSCVPRGRCAIEAMVSKLSEWLCVVLRRWLACQLRLGGCGVAPHHPVTTRPLGDVEGLVRGLHQGFPAVAIPWEDGDSQAQGEIGNGL